ncbi:MAG: chromosome partitioning protein ParB [Deltaproteobacteria bacterium]|nr:chromosome partitioning protein ParB [Deltaproteobacteria bacterium]
MVDEVEISSFDLRYENYRVKHPAREKNLLASIQEQGIREPLQGVDTVETPESPGVRILLNGFKRYRCAQKLSLLTVPYSCLGNDEAFGLITLLKIATAKTLTILEQARLIDELHKVHKLGVSEMAHLLEKSQGWVSIRIGMIEQMSEVVMDKIFKGQFPAYSYMYSIRPFMRIKGIKKEDIDEFVSLASGKSLSTRDVDLLAGGYFNGGEDFREQLKNGDIGWVLSHLKEKVGATDDCTELERRALREFENFRYSMSKIIHYSSDNRLKSPSFLALAHTWVGKTIKQMAGFNRCLEDLHDRTGQA